MKVQVRLYTRQHGGTLGNHHGPGTDIDLELPIVPRVGEEVCLADRWYTITSVRLIVGPSENEGLAAGDVLIWLVARE